MGLAQVPEQLRHPFESPVCVQWSGVVVAEVAPKHQGALAVKRQRLSTHDTFQILHSPYY